MDRNRSSVKRQRIFLFQASSLIIDEESTIQYKYKDAEKDKTYPKGYAREQQLNIDHLSKVDKSNLCGQCWMAFEARVIKQSRKMVKNCPQIFPIFPPTHDPFGDEFGTANDKSFFDICDGFLSRRCTCDKTKRHVRIDMANSAEIIVVSTTRGSEVSGAVLILPQLQSENIAQVSKALTTQQQVTVSTTHVVCNSV